MERRCSHCLQVILGDGGSWPPWCPHCGANVGSDSAAPPSANPGLWVGQRELAEANRGRRWNPWDGLAAFALLAIIGGVVAGIVWLESWDPEKEVREVHLARWRALLNQKLPASIEFCQGDQCLTIDKRAEVEEFLLLVCGGKRVKPHHSHPVDEVALSFSASPDTYFLGRDSWQTDEYWLQVQLPERPGATQRVLQFSSAEMEKWLQRNKVAALMKIRSK